jgi:hypothetical protein
MIQSQLNINFYFNFYSICNSDFIQFCYVLIYCTNLSAVFILTLFTHIIITRCSVLLLLHSEQLLCHLYSWCVQGVLCFYAFCITNIIDYFNIPLGYDPCKHLLNVNKGKEHKCMQALGGEKTCRKKTTCKTIEVWENIITALKRLDWRV